MGFGAGLDHLALAIANQLLEFLVACHRLIVAHAQVLEPILNVSLTHQFFRDLTGELGVDTC